MKTTYRSEKLEEAFAALSANYRGTDIDLYAVCRDRRATSPNNSASRNPSRS